MSFVLGFEIKALYTFSDNLDGSFPKFVDGIDKQPAFGNNLSKDDLLKMSPSQIIVFAKNGDALAQLWLGDAIYNGSIPNWRSERSSMLAF